MKNNFKRYVALFMAVVLLFLSGIMLTNSPFKANEDGGEGGTPSTESSAPAEVGSTTGEGGSSGDESGGSSGGESGDNEQNGGPLETIIDGITNLIGGGEDGPENPEVPDENQEGSGEIVPGDPGTGGGENNPENNQDEDEIMSLELEEEEEQEVTIQKYYTVYDPKEYARLSSDEKEMAISSEELIDRISVVMGSDKTENGNTIAIGEYFDLKFYFVDNIFANGFPPKGMSTATEDYYMIESDTEYKLGELDTDVVSGMLADGAEKRTKDLTLNTDNGEITVGTVEFRKDGSYYFHTAKNLAGLLKDNDVQTLENAEVAIKTSILESTTRQPGDVIVIDGVKYVVGEAKEQRPSVTKTLSDDRAEKVTNADGTVEYFSTFEIVISPQGSKSYPGDIVLKDVMNNANNRNLQFVGGLQMKIGDGEYATLDESKYTVSEGNNGFEMTIPEYAKTSDGKDIYLKYKAKVDFNGAPFEITAYNEAQLWVSDEQTPFASNGGNIVIQTDNGTEISVDKMSIEKAQDDISNNTFKWKILVTNKTSKAATNVNILDKGKDGKNSWNYVSDSIVIKNGESVITTGYVLTPGDGTNNTIFDLTIDEIPGNTTYVIEYTTSLNTGDAELNNLINSGNYKADVFNNTVIVTGDNFGVKNATVGIGVGKIIEKSRASYIEREMVTFWKVKVGKAGYTVKEGAYFIEKPSNPDIEVIGISDDYAPSNYGGNQDTAAENYRRKYKPIFENDPVQQYPYNKGLTNLFKVEKDAAEGFKVTVLKEFTGVKEFYVATKLSDRFFLNNGKGAKVTYSNNITLYNGPGEVGLPAQSDSVTDALHYSLSKSNAMESSGVERWHIDFNRSREMTHTNVVVTDKLGENLILIEDEPEWYPMLGFRDGRNSIRIVKESDRTEADQPYYTYNKGTREVVFHLGTIEKSSVVKLWTRISPDVYKNGAQKFSIKNEAWFDSDQVPAPLYETATVTRNDAPLTKVAKPTPTDPSKLNYTVEFNKGRVALPANVVLRDTMSSNLSIISKISVKRDGADYTGFTYTEAENAEGRPVIEINLNNKENDTGIYKIEYVGKVTAVAGQTVAAIENTIEAVDILPGTKTDTRTVDITDAAKIDGKIYSVFIKKVDKFNNPLKGAEFELKSGTEKYTIETDGGGIATLNLVAKTAVWTIKETKAPNGYQIRDLSGVTVTAGQYGDMGSAYEVVDEPVYGDLKIKKVGNIGNIPLEGAAFKLEANDVVIKGYENPVQVTGADGVTVFNGLPVGTYTLTEVLPPIGYYDNPNTYTVTVANNGSVTVAGLTKDSNGNFQVVNDAKVKDVSFTKMASHGNVALSKVEFVLKQNGTQIDRVGSDNSGNVVFTNVRFGTYTIEEIAPKGFIGEEPLTVVVNDSGYTITKADGTKVNNIVYNTAVTSLTVNKVWKDNNDGNRPAISIQLYKKVGDGDPQAVVGRAVSLPLAEGGNPWSYTFTDLPVYEAGDAITYSVKENDIANYVVSYNPENVEAKEGVISNTIEITNTLTGTVDLSAEKAWEDKEDSFKTRPAAITYNLLKKVGTTTEAVKDDNGDPITAQGTPDDWGAKFVDLPKYDDNGVEIQYVITEDKVPGYTTSEPKVVDGVYKFTNTLETAVLKVKKTFDMDDVTTLSDQEKADLMAGAKFIVYMVVDNGEDKQVDSATYDKFENNEIEFKVAPGKKYYVVEESGQIPNYTLKATVTLDEDTFEYSDVNVKANAVEVDKNNEIAFTNRYEKYLGDVKDIPVKILINKVEKIEDDLVPINANAVFEITGPDNAKATVSSKNEDGFYEYLFEKVGKYTIKETQAPGGYTTPGMGEWEISIDRDEENAKVEFDSQKNIFVKVFQFIINGFSKEDKNYEKITGDEGKLTIINEKELTSVSVTKNWVDNAEGSDGDYPDIELTLYETKSVDGEESTDKSGRDDAVKVLSSESFDKGATEWTWEWPNLPTADNDGNRIKYSVKETMIGDSVVDNNKADGWTVTYGSDTADADTEDSNETEDENSFVITNTKDTKKVEVVKEFVGLSQDEIDSLDNFKITAVGENTGQEYALVLKADSPAGDVSDSVTLGGGNEDEGIPAKSVIIVTPYENEEAASGENTETADDTDNTDTANQAVTPNKVTIKWLFDALDDDYIVTEDIDGAKADGYDFTASKYGVGDELVEGRATVTERDENDVKITVYTITNTYKKIKLRIKKTLNGYNEGDQNATFVFAVESARGAVNAEGQIVNEPWKAVSGITLSGAGSGVTEIPLDIKWGEKITITETYSGANYKLTDGPTIIEEDEWDGENGKAVLEADGFYYITVEFTNDYDPTVKNEGGIVNTYNKNGVSAEGEKPGYTVNQGGVQATLPEDVNKQGNEE